MSSLKSQGSSGKWFTLLAKTNPIDISELWGHEAVIRKLNPSAHCLSKSSIPTRDINLLSLQILYPSAILSYSPPKLFTAEPINTTSLQFLSSDLHPRSHPPPHH